MKQIYKYKNSFALHGISNINRIVKTEDGYISIHHELKNGFPRLYWFSVFINDKIRYDINEEPYISFDIRDIWKIIGKKQPEKWYKMTDRKRLTEVSQTIEAMSIKSPENFIQQCRQWWQIYNDLPLNDLPF